NEHVLPPAGHPTGQSPGKLPAISVGSFDDFSVHARLIFLGKSRLRYTINAVETMKLPALTVNERGSGSKQYPPRVMLALLVYCYANGIFGSRRIERATYRDIAVRYLTGDTHPDHDTICAFRRGNGEAVRQAFAEVL